MEPIITIRANRYVIPVKEEYRSQIKGFIHDISSSGSTVFIEPISIFELNNKIANLKIEENIEIENILANLTSMLYDYTNYLKSNISILGNLDLIFAKASYSLDIDGICPKINNDKFDDRLLLFDCLNSLMWLDKYPKYELYNDILFNKSRKLLR